MTISPEYKMAAPMWTQDGHHKMASRGEKLGVIRPAGEGSWGQPGLQGWAVRGNQANMGQQLGAIGKQGSS